MASHPITSWQIDGETMEQWKTLFSWAPKSLWMVTAAKKLKDACFLKRRYDQPRQHIKKQRHYFADKGPSRQSYDFSSSHIWMLWHLTGSWTIKKTEHWRRDAFELWCWRGLLRVPWTTRRSNQVILKGNQSWIFFGRTDSEAEAPILWPPDAKNWLVGKDPDAGKDWRQEEKGTTEDKIVG